MRQEKVASHKEQKKNRKKIIKRQKPIFRLAVTAIVVAVVALVSWFSVSVYKNVKATKEANRETVTTEWNVTDYDNYQTQLQAYVSDSDEDADASASSSATSDEAASSSSAAEETASSSAESVVSSTSAE